MPSWRAFKAKRRFSASRGSISTCTGQSVNGTRAPLSLSSIWQASMNSRSPGMRWLMTIFSTCSSESLSICARARRRSASVGVVCVFIVLLLSVCIVLGEQFGERRSRGPDVDLAGDLDLAALRLVQGEELGELAVGREFAAEVTLGGGLGDHALAAQFGGPDL